VHETDSPADYRIGHWECTATRALDEFQAKWHRVDSSLPRAARLDALADRRRREAGRHPDRSRSWFTYTEAEGPPR